MIAPTTPRLAAVAFAGALLLAGCSGDDLDQGSDPGNTTTSAAEGTLRGMTRDPVPDVSAVTLPDATQDGADFAFVGPEDGLLLVFFGFTNCPDVCPTTLADVRSAMEELGSDADRLDVAMATIDPERDTADVLTDYVQTFVPDAHALVTTDDAVLRAATDAFGAEYIIETDADGEPDVTHTGFLYAVDSEGRMVITWPFGTSSADIAHDIDLLLAEA
jgi:protein SCO1/2